MKAPIAIMSFNRPNYLAETLMSLKAQANGTLDGREIHLFQDGAINLYSKIIYADKADIAACIDIFKTAFPEGQVHSWNDNIGICENFYRAENYVFHERQFEYAYFFEDDLVLSPVYLEMMEILQNFAARAPRLAYFSAYGDYYAVPEEVQERRRELVNLDHHWAFGLRREHWAKIREYLTGYYKIVRGEDYARRDHNAIFEYFADRGAVPRGSSQDAAKAWACDQLGLWRCRTFVPYARYIGSTGAHMTQEAYDAIGFARTIVSNEVVDDLAFPDDAGIDVRLAEQRALYVSVMQNELPALLASLPAREFNPMRRCTAEIVRMAYRLLLHRDPESEAVIERHVRETTVYALVRGLTRSKEFLGLAGRIDHPW
jgi:hypothetical protein